MKAVTSCYFILLAVCYLNQYSNTLKRFINDMYSSAVIGNECID